MKKIIQIYVLVFILFNLCFFTFMKTQPDIHGILMRITNSSTPDEKLFLDKEGNVHEKRNDNSKAMEKTAAAIISMKANLGKNVNLIVAPTLSKNLPGTIFKADSYDTNISTDLFISLLNSYHIPVLDYRTRLNEEAKVSDLFYQSDSMMTVKTSFWAFQEFVKFYNEKFNVQLDPKEYFTKQENYLIQTYLGAFAGSYTKDMGKYYVKADDFSVIYPNFETHYQIIYDKGQNDGSFQSTLLNINKLGSSTEMDQIYLSAIKTPSVIVNQTAPTDERIYVIYDDNSSAFVAFLTTAFREVHLASINNVPANITNYIQSNQIKNVLFSISTEEACFDSIVK